MQTIKNPNTTNHFHNGK